MKKEDINVANNDKIYLIVDTDLKSSKVNELIEIEEKCKENGIKIITSAPTFEIWYFIHFRSNNLVFQNSESVKRALKEYIPDYKETKNVFSTIENDTDKAIRIS